MRYLCRRIREDDGMLARRGVLAAAALVLCIGPSCKQQGAIADGEGAIEQVVRLATTTSTDNSGLLEVLLPPFEERYGLRVDVISVGTGKALAYGRNGDVDVVLVHAKKAEDRFVAQGAGVNRRDVMFNDFVIVGPSNDPAGIASTEDASAALTAIALHGATFVSRGDDSGTHKREMELWQHTGISPGGAWYLSVGQGMGAALGMAYEKQAYCLTDRGTWLALGRDLELKVLLQGDERLNNPYGIIPVNPARYPEVNHVGAMALVGWMTSPEGQRIIGTYTIAGEQLFHPLALPGDQESRP
jgi:tungstate transport system substrate-binding protein